jgi:hypothetical protein
MGQEEGEVIQSLQQIFDSIDTPEGHAKFRAYLDSQPFPHFEAHPTVKDALIWIDEDGTRTAGRFVDRKFVGLDSGE